MTVKSPALKVTRPKHSLDLTKVIPVHADLQAVVLKFDVDQDKFYFMSHRHQSMTLITTQNAKRLSDFHPETLVAASFGCKGGPLLWLSLALCIELYGRARALDMYKAFADKYLQNLPVQSFHKTLYVPL